MSRLNEQIGLRLKAARKAANFKTAREFSCHYHIPETTFAQHEAGKRALKVETLIYYCRILGIDPGWLLTGRSLSSMMKNGDPQHKCPIKKSMDSKLYKKLNQDKSLAIEELTHIIDWDFLVESLSAMDPHHYQITKEFLAEMWHSVTNLVQKLTAEKA